MTCDRSDAAPDAPRDATVSTIGALAGAVDDQNRAALILRQESRPADQRFRSPYHLRRIAEQFSDRARRCHAALDALVAATPTDTD